MELRPEATEGVDCKAESNLLLGRTLLADAIRTRKGIDYIESPSVWSVIMSFFFFGSHFCLDLHGTAWFHLREATTLALTLGMHEQATYKSLDRIECTHRRRLYWLLFVTERAYALQQHRPLTLYATINLPSFQDEPEEAEKLNGFLHMVKLYRPFDDSFVGLWNKAKTGCTTEWLAQVQQQLSDALPVYLQGTESQAVDVKVSQKWLRTLVWQLSMSHGYLSSAAADKAMSFQFPIEISRDLVAVTAQFSQQAMEVHGIGLIEKLFDVSCTLIDVMSCVPIEQHSFDFGPREYLHQMMTLISNLRGGQQRYTPLLVSKINDTMPDMGYALAPSMTDSTSQHGVSRSNSNESSFGSPPLSALDSQTSPFGFPQDLGVDVSSTASMFAGATSSTASMFASAMISNHGIEYGDMAASGPTQMFVNPLVFQDPVAMKLEPDG
ncbi:hypothetical protein LTR37_003890 [Vermiconidia calcicola]|uniref:Uncharacterized protein n=1 Tax=Vermiconidia calcicola TaxID=1690605 RepID=A0ACC3NNY3_9PEZI|nr:hypothetical protein LTR37_003890 [Vermiconidia calcicola]